MNDFSLQPAFLHLALDLSQAAYSLQLEPWLDHGWADIAIQVDEALVSGLNAQDAAARRNALQSASHIRARLERLDPISQYFGMRRQREALDTCKALVMTHPLRNGRTALVIAFAGTSKRLFDWVSNLRVEEEEGFHAGFLALTRQFEESCAHIQLPQTAKALGLAQLTLEDALCDLKRPDSHFTLMVTGHSQGAALMQIFLHRLLNKGVPSHNVIGCGFASPRVIFSRDLQNAVRYPIYHIINADDLVARVGGAMHLGCCRVLPSDRAFRALCYGKYADERAMRDMLLLQHTVRSTQSALLLGIAALQSLHELPDSEAEAVLDTFAPDFIPGLLTQRLTGYAKKLLRAAIRRLQAKHESTFGPMDEQKLAQYTAYLRMFFLRYGTQKTIQLLRDALLLPHSLHGGQGVRAYEALVTRYAHLLLPALWCEETPPVWATRMNGRYLPPARPTRDRFHRFSSAHRAARQLRYGQETRNEQNPSP